MAASFHYLYPRPRYLDPAIYPDWRPLGLTKTPGPVAYEDRTQQWYDCQLDIRDLCSLPLCRVGLPGQWIQLGRGEGLLSGQRMSRGAWKAPGACLWVLQLSLRRSCQGPRRALRGGVIGSLGGWREGSKNTIWGVSPCYGFTRSELWYWRRW